MKIYRNIFHLFIWQGSTYLVPLIVTPYLARVLGLERYGIFGFSFAVISYGAMFTDWGFNLSATQKVARAAANPALLRTLFWGTLVAKVGLSVVALTMLSIAIVLVPSFHAIWPTLLASSITIVATALSTNWFLQGLQFMGAFAVSALIGRLLTLPLMLFFVHGPDDVAIAAAIQASTQLVSAIASIVVSARHATLGPIDFNLRYAFRQIQDGWLQFVSSISINMYTQFNAVFVGFIAGPAQAGLLTGSQRIAWAMQGLVNPISMAMYPHVNNLTVTDPSHAYRMMFRVLGAQALLAACLSSAMYVLAPLLVLVLLGPSFHQAVPVVQILAFMPFFASVTDILGPSMMLPIGLKLSYTVSLAAAGAVNGLALITFSPRLGAIGGAISAVITEVFLIAAMSGALYLKRATFERMRRGHAP